MISRHLTPSCSAHSDSIEANVENAEVHVERGTEQLQRASYYQVDQQHLLSLMQPFAHHLLIIFSRLFQQKSRRRMCILALVCSVALVLLAIIIWQVNK